VGLPAAGAFPFPTSADPNLSIRTPRLQSDLNAILLKSFLIIFPFSQPPDLSVVSASPQLTFNKQSQQKGSVREITTVLIIPELAS
jgi:hypothetical protein